MESTGGADSDDDDMMAAAPDNNNITTTAADEHNVRDEGDHSRISDDDTSREIEISPTRFQELCPPGRHYGMLISSLC